MKKIVFDNESSKTFYSAHGICQVINRKKYDTDTADLLWTDEYWFDPFDMHPRQKWFNPNTNPHIIDGILGPHAFYCGVALFRKKNGEYFRYNVKWEEYSDGFYRPTLFTLKPLTEEEAKDLTEKFVPSRYIDIFGDVEE